MQSTSTEDLQIRPKLTQARFQFITSKDLENLMQIEKQPDTTLVKCWVKELLKCKTFLVVTLRLSVVTF